MPTQNGGIDFSSPEFNRLFREALPELGFFGELADRKLGPNTPQGRFFQNQYGSILNEFAGRQAQDPSLYFQDFIEDFPFTRRFAGTPPNLAGRGTSRFNPRTRFLFY